MSTKAKPEPADQTVEDYEAQQLAEYSTYVAVVPITTDDGVLAYAEGHPVPVSNVKAHGYDELGWVKKRPEAEQKAYREAARASLYPDSAE